ncbi:MAG: DUF2851 family protein [Prolixibacteraceae bacterium]|nr:DUF2851 family protein [Prolixibacteraceae bacterium]MDD4755380.1 DUF2851 family protein [Prolixibacteraceae bacterium]
MHEKFIYYVWKNRLFNSKKLKTTEGEPLEIIYTGIQNRNSGPDFFNAKIKIGNTVWAGNIEIHKKASDWEKHNHGRDKAYDNVILHVVERADKKTFRSNGSEIATLEISWPEEYTRNYQKLLSAKTWIACQDEFHRIDPLFIRMGFHRLMVERLEEKTSEIIVRLTENKNDWNETFWQFLAKVFGFKINAMPFLLLAKSVPYNILSKHKNSLFQLESLLFGASGLLNEELSGDDYFQALRNEFNFLHKKYKLKTVEAHLWKFMRLRPANFPTVRISQLARLIYNSQGLFSKIVEIENPEQIKSLFKTEASEYWDSHFRFNRASEPGKSKMMGEASVNLIILNVVVPFLFVYGDHQNLTMLKNRALDFLEKIPPENNAIIRRWKKLGINPCSAFETQALLQLKSGHCDKKNCLNCPVGSKIVKFTHASEEIN